MESEAGFNDTIRFSQPINGVSSPMQMVSWIRLPLGH